MNTYLYPLLFVFAMLGYSCSMNGPEWDVDILAPGAETTLDIANLVGSEYISTGQQGELYLDFEQTVYDFNLDTLTNIKNVSSGDDIRWVLGNYTIPAGTTLGAQVFSLDLNLDGVNLTAATIQDGQLQLVIKSLLRSGVTFTYDIPDATKNGVPFTLTDFISASNGTDTVLYTRVLDLSGYNLSLTGVNGNTYNQLKFFITPKFEDQVTVSQNEFMFRVENKIVNMSPSYIKGYFGQPQIVGGQDTAVIDFFNKIKSGTIDLPNLVADMVFENYLGANIRIFPNEFKGLNSKTGVMVPLTHPVIGNSINIDRAVQISGFPPVQAVTQVISFNAGNSNIEQFAENIPDKILFSFSAQLNPLGNLAANNDFFFPRFPPEVKVKFNAPLKASINNIVFEDTIDYNLTDATELDNFRDGKFRIHVQNGYPLETEIQLVLLDDAGNVTATLFTNNTIAAAPVDGNLVVIAPQSSVVEVPINTDKIAALKSAKKMLIRARMLTLPQTQQVHLYAHYKIRLKIIADITYHINL